MGSAWRNIAHPVPLAACSINLMTRRRKASPFQSTALVVSGLT